MFVDGKEIKDREYLLVKEKTGIFTSAFKCISRMWEKININKNHKGVLKILVVVLKQILNVPKTCKKHTLIIDG